MQQVAKNIRRKLIDIAPSDMRGKWEINIAHTGTPRGEGGISH